MRTLKEAAEARNFEFEELVESARMQVRGNNIGCNVLLEWLIFSTFPSENQPIRNSRWTHDRVARCVIF